MSQWTMSSHCSSCSALFARVGVRDGLMCCARFFVARGDRDRAPRQVFRDHELQLSRHREAPRIIVIVRRGVPRFELQPGVLAPAAEALPMFAAVDGLVQVTVALHALQHQV